MELQRIESLQRIPNELAAMKMLTDSFMHDVERRGYDAETIFAIVMGFAEALANAFKHGNLRDPAKCIIVCYRLDRARAELEVRDEGGGFDPSQIPDAASDDGLDRPTGRGVLLMRSLFDEVRFLHGGRSVRLVKRVSTAKAEVAIYDPPLRLVAVPLGRESHCFAVHPVVKTTEGPGTNRTADIVGPSAHDGVESQNRLVKRLLPCD